MRYDVFHAFMDFFRTHIERNPTVDDLKVYIKGGYAIRIGPCIFEYNFRTQHVEQVSGPIWESWAR